MTFRTDVSNRPTRIAKAAMIVNAILHCIGSFGLAAGATSHTASEAALGRREAAAGLAAIVMFVGVSRHLERDPALIALPLAFVFANLFSTVVDLLLLHDPRELAPLAAEATFLGIYAVCAMTTLRRRGAVTP
jgi:hypothetical protein